MSQIISENGTVIVRAGTYLDNELQKNGQGKFEQSSACSFWQQAALHLLWVCVDPHLSLKTTGKKTEQ